MTTISPKIAVILPDLDDEKLDRVCELMNYQWIDVVKEQLKQRIVRKLRKLYSDENDER